MFNSDVDHISVAQTIRAIEEAPKKFNVLVIEWNSPGGEVYSGFLLAKAIEEARIPIVCVVDGQADSMAFYILQSCPVRLMTKRSVLMMHEARFAPGVPMGPSQIMELQALNFSMAEHYAAHMCLNVDQIQSRINHMDWWMTWRDAAKVGAIDGTVRSVQDVVAWYQFSMGLPPGVELAPACS